MSELRANAEALTALLQDPDADSEQIRDLADSLAGAVLRNANDRVSTEQALALGRVLGQRMNHEDGAMEAALVTNGRGHFLPDEYLHVEFRTGFECGVAADGSVSS